MIPFQVIQVKMKRSISTITTMLAVFAITSCCQDCCTRYIVFTDPSDYPTKPDNCTCDIPLNQLLINNEVIVKGGLNNCSNIEVLFKSGIYSAKGTNNSYYQRQSFQLVFKNASSITIKGQQNGTFNCFKQLKIVLQDIADIDMKEIRTSNCQFFIETFYPLTTIVTEIIDSRFTDTNFVFQYLESDDIDIETDANSIMVITVGNTIIERCCSSRKEIIISVVGPLNSEISITLQNFIMSDNNSPLFYLLVGNMVSITFVGKNYFLNNTDVIINSEYFFPSNSLFHFKESEVYIMNNRVNDRKSDDGAPMHLIGATVLFWHSYVVFSNNEGSLCGGMFADDDTKIIFDNNSTILFTNNRGITGVALSMQQGTTLIFNATKLGIAINFTDNTAQRGGAIYMKDGESISSIFNLQCDTSLVKLTFRNNSISSVGWKSDLWRVGGLVCR